MNPKPLSSGGVIARMAGHSVAANLIMLTCLIGGFIAMQKIKKEVFPEIELDVVTVSVSYPGASPEEIESGILLVLEETVRSVEGVDEITSNANEGSGSVSAELVIGSDADKVARDIESEVNKISTFPEDAEDPHVRVAGHQRDVLEVVFYGDAPYKTLHNLAEQFRVNLLQDPDISQVDLEDVPDLEIQIEVSMENLRRYNLSIAGIAEKLRKATVDIPGGGLRTDKGDILVRVKERRDWGRQIARLPIITTSSGSEILLGEIASIEDGYEENERYSTYNGMRAISMEIFRIGDQTPLSVASAVKKRLEEFKPHLPQGIEPAIWHDRSDIYKQRVELLLKNLSIGLALVLLLLGLFLEIRLAFWVMLGIPISFLGAFLFLPVLGVTINMISLFGFIIAMGIVVDDAIVVGENVYSYRQKGHSALDAAVKGAQEVAMPVTFSILTNIAAFMPIYFIPGTMGKIFKVIPLVVCTAFIISLIESLFVLPAHLGHQKQNHGKGLSGFLYKHQQSFSQGFSNAIKTIYGPFLSFALRHRIITISFSVTLLVLFLSYALSGRMRMQLFPVVESDFSLVSIVMPYGSPVEKTERVCQKVINSAKQVVAETGHPELVQSIVADIGRGGSHAARVRVELAEPQIRRKIMSTSEFTQKWRASVGEISDVEYIRYSAESGGPGSRHRPIEVELSHVWIPTLEKASQELAEILEAFPGVKDVDDGFQPGKEQLDFTITNTGRSLGLSAYDIARQLRQAFYGAEVVKQQRGRNEVKTVVRLPEKDRASEQILNDFMINTSNGAFVPLKDVIKMKRGRAYTTIERRNGSRGVNVSADINPRSMADEVLTNLKENDLPRLTHKYPGLKYTFRGHRADIRESMGSLKISFLFAMLIIYAMLAIPFKSYIQPFIVMLTIPFGIVGAFLGHLIMGYNLSIPSMFGIIALAGVVVNDSLVMIAFANDREKQKGYSKHRAIHAAAIQRFRPVLLTTLTTFAGLSPMIFETSRQARFLIPMALSLGFGIVFATVITLVIIPSMYLVVEDIRRVGAAVYGFVFDKE